jgi:hypothetical protein
MGQTERAQALGFRAVGGFLCAALCEHQCVARFSG